jgi:flagellar biogenesis protein FliO
MTDSYLYLLVKSILTLLFVLGLMGAALYALRLYMRKTGTASVKGAKAPVRVITTAFMGPKRNIAVVEVAGEVLVLGLTPQSITFLTKIEDAAAKEEMKKFGENRKRPLLGLLQGGI